MQCQKMPRILWICAIILPALLSRNCLLKKQGHKFCLTQTLSAEEKFKEFKEQPLFALQNESDEVLFDRHYDSHCFDGKKVLAQKSWNVSHYIGWPTNFLYLHFMVPIKLAAPTMHIAFCWKKVFNWSGRFRYYGPPDAIEWVLPMSLNTGYVGPVTGARGGTSNFRNNENNAFSTNAQSRFASVVIYAVLGPLRLEWHTWQCPCFSIAPEATHEASRGPLKRVVSAPKALQEFETEMELLGGTEEKSVLWHWVIGMPSRQNQ